jgi:hypothetical protein
MRISFSILVTCAALCALAACKRIEEPAAPDDGNDFDWARAALERNPQLEIVATDSDSEVFTVRNKQTGEVLALKLDELVAAPVSQLSRAPMTQVPTPPEVPAAPAAPGAPAAASATAPASSDDERAAQAAQQIAPSSSQPSDTPGYTIERADGQLRVSGPGVSIVSSGGSSATSSAPSAQRTVEPVICEGRRMLQLDARDIHVEGDAIIARGGCELYITNSRVVGSSVGVVIQDAVVHIANSHVEGATASFVADDGAKLYLRNSTFQGLSRRGERASVQDQGGNRWR